jgi:HPt (histidine-containing phosphotransfer) domain-containing protein
MENKNETLFGHKSKIIKVFCRDAFIAAKTIRETIINDDLKKFTIAVHSMKSALANIGEKEKSILAADLEKAGFSGNKDFIYANAEQFAQDLETLAKSLNVESAGEKIKESAEDRVFLTGQLRVIEAACNDYDDTAAYAALDLLEEQSWSAQTSNVLENIRETLFLRSDFEKAAQLAKAYAQRERPRAAQINTGELEALLAELKPLLEKSDFSASFYVEKLEGFAGMEELALCIDDYDFERALELLNAIMQT